MVGEGSLPDDRLLVASSQGGRAQGVLWGLFYKSTNPILEAFTLMTYYALPKAPPPSTITFGCLDFNM